MMKLGYRIYVQMKERGLTQAQLAEKSGLSQQIISNYINNKFKPGYDAIFALSEALEVNPAWFFDVAAVPTGNIIVFGKVQQGGTLKVGHFLPMDNLPQPVSVDKGVGIIVNLYWLIFDKLVNAYSLSGPMGRIAYNWKQGGNYWLFNLFEGITFHNGQICTAEDVEYSYQQWMAHNKDKNPIQIAQMIDTYTFLLELKEERELSDVPMPFIVPKGTDDKYYKFVGTGPFKALDIRPDFWRLQAHKGYHRSQPFFDDVVVKQYQSPKELENALFDEQVHLAVGVDLKDERFNVQTEAAAQRYELVFRLNLSLPSCVTSGVDGINSTMSHKTANKDSPLCRDVRFRKAIYYGLDRAPIAQAAGLKKPHFAKGPFDYVLDELSELPPKPDIQKAKQLLNEVPNITETRLSFEISYVEPKREAIVREIIAQLNALGIQTEMVQNKADVAVVLLNTRTPYLERQIWQNDGKANVTGYHNPAVEKMLNNLSDISMDTALLKRIQILIEEDYPSIPLFYNEWPITYVKNLRALENRMILMTMLNDIHTWYFEPEAELVPFHLQEEIEREREAGTSLSEVG